MSIKSKADTRFHVLQHVDFEEPASIKVWLLKKGHSYSTTCLYKNDLLPSHETYDILIIMGESIPKLVEN